MAGGKGACSRGRAGRAAVEGALLCLHGLVVHTTKSDTSCVAANRHFTNLKQPGKKKVFRKETHQAVLWVSTGSRRCLAGQ